MNSKFVNHLKRSFCPALIFLITFYLIWKNYVPGTWLSGWDTLHPEFNFGLNLKRVIDGVWREEQGLGAYAAHAHMADLPRILIMWFFSAFLPISDLRYLYIFLCLSLGPLGMFYFARKVIFREKTSFNTEAAAFVGALFYMLNLGTLQHFYVPFEMFPVQFAALPWLFLLATNLLEKKSYYSHKKRQIAAFITANFLAAPMAYASQLWFAFFACFTLYLAVLAIKTKAGKQAVIVLFITLATNAFWLLPNVYFLLTHAKEIPWAKTNQLFSQEAFLANKEFGTIGQTAVLKNFLFTWSEHTGKGNFGYLLDEWRVHLRSISVSAIGYLFALLTLGGLVVGLKKKHLISLAVLPVFVVSFLAIVNMNPPFNFIFEFFREKSFLFKEGLRFPFTKFSILLSFSFAAYLAVFLNSVWGWLGIKRLVWLNAIQAGILTLLLIIYLFPAFQGNLISPSMKINFPNEYFQMFDWFNKQSEQGRVAYLPIHNPYGWAYYDWGFQGAGFVWFGMKQPFLDRDFDRWNPANEEYYREMSYAIYKKDSILVTQLLEKYHIRWIIFDQTVIQPGKDSSNDVLFYPEIKEILSNSRDIGYVTSFGGKLDIYKVNSLPTTEQSVYKVEVFSQIEPKFRWANIDTAYQENGHYFSDDNEGQISYPVRSFIGLTDNIPNNIVDFTNQGILLNLNQPLSGKTLELPSPTKKETSLYADVYLSRNQRQLTVRLVYKLPQLNAIDNNNPTNEMILVAPQDEFFVSFGKYQTFIVNKNGNFAPYLLGQVELSTKEVNDITLWQKQPLKQIAVDLSTLNIIPEACYKPELSGSFGVINNHGQNTITLTAEKVPICANINLGSVKPYEIFDAETLVQTSFQASGKTPQFCYYDISTNRCLKTTDNFINPGVPGMTNLRFYLDPENSGEEIFSSLTGINLAFFRPLTKKSFTPSLLPVEANLTSRLTEIKYDFPVFPEGQVNLAQPRHQPRLCGNTIPTKYHRAWDTPNSVLEYSSLKGSVCDFFELSNLPHNQGFALVIETKNVDGLPLRLCLANYTTRHCDLFTQLGSQKEFNKEIFIIPPTGEDGYGYDLHFNNYSVGNMPSTNQIKSLAVYPFPYNWLKSIKTVNDTNQQKGKLLLVSDQAYEKSWRAFVYNPPFSFQPLGKHVTVDNWANGWIVDEKPSGQIVTIYVPQVLEYLGFLVLILLILNLVLYKTPSRLD